MHITICHPAHGHADEFARVLADILRRHDASLGVVFRSHGNVAATISFRRLSDFGDSNIEADCVARTWHRLNGRPGFAVWFGTTPHPLPIYHRPEHV